MTNQPATSVALTPNRTASPTLVLCTCLGIGIAITLAASARPNGLRAVTVMLCSLGPWPCNIVSTIAPNYGMNMLREIQSQYGCYALVL